MPYQENNVFRAENIWQHVEKPVNSKRTGTLTQYNSPYNWMKPS